MPKTSPEHLTMRREQILSAAMLCFARDGFHAASMAQVIKASKMSAGSVYRYFPNKRALIHASAKRAMAMIGAMATEALTEPVGDDLLEAVAALSGRIARKTTAEGMDFSAMAIAIWAEAARDESLRGILSEGYGSVRGQIEESIRVRQSTGAVSTDIDAARLAQAIFALIPGLVVENAIFRDVDGPAAIRALGSATAL